MSSRAAEVPKPLAGRLVVDLTRVLAGPYCTMILRHLGADVVKVEAPGLGDDARHFPPFVGGDLSRSAYFASINAGKRSLVLDLKRPEGLEVLSDLARRADVLVENFRPGTLERLGLSAERLNELNPRLIYATLTGFGYTGPQANSAAYDMMIQALSGLIAITGTEDGQCVRVGSSIADIITGIYGALGILAALLRREQSGAGTRVDVAMFDSTVAILENAVVRAQLADEPPRPLGLRHSSITPFDGYHAQDGVLIIAAGNDKLFAELCQALGLADLPHDPRFCTNALRTRHQAELKALMEAELGAQPCEHWLRVLGDCDIPCARVQPVGELLNNAQLLARHMLLPIREPQPFLVVGDPIKFAGEDQETDLPPAPALGEHSTEVLRDVLGYGEARITALRAAGALPTEP